MRAYGGNAAGFPTGNPNWSDPGQRSRSGVSLAEVLSMQCIFEKLRQPQVRRDYLTGRIVAEGYSNDILSSLDLMRSQFFLLIHILG